MNKNILKYIPMLMALLMVSCSSDDTLEGNAPSVQVAPELIDDKYGVTAIMSGYEDYLADEDNSPLTRSTMVYDRANKLMKFAWTIDDKIAVFYLDGQEKGNQFAFELDYEETKKYENSSYGVFANPDPALGYPLHPTAGYASYIPYKEQTMETGIITYDAVPVTFRNQQQRANVKMNCYWQKANDTDDNAIKYYESEKEACAHLPQYNYQVSNVISTPTAHMHFKYTPLTSIVRFYMYAPEAIYFDSLQVVNHDADFVLDATMDVANGNLNPVNTSHVLSLSFKDVDGPNVGIDMTNNSDSSKETFNYWDQDYPTDGYIMAYMMIAPINLKQDNISNSTLYLCGHDKNGVKQYYKATLSKINFEAGKHHQWVIDPTKEAPITFTKVTVQEWKSHVYNNTKDGNGTATW